MEDKENRDFIRENDIQRKVLGKIEAGEVLEVLSKEDMEMIRNSGSGEGLIEGLKQIKSSTEAVFIMLPHDADKKEKLGTHIVIIFLEKIIDILEKDDGLVRIDSNVVLIGENKKIS